MLRFGPLGMFFSAVFDTPLPVDEIAPKSENPLPSASYKRTRTTTGKLAWQFHYPYANL